MPVNTRKRAPRVSLRAGKALWKIVRCKRLILHEGHVKSLLLDETTHQLFLSPYATCHSIGAAFRTMTGKEVYAVLRVGNNPIRVLLNRTAPGILMRLEREVFPCGALGIGGMIAIPTMACTSEVGDAIARAISQLPTPSSTQRSRKH